MPRAPRKSAKREAGDGSPGCSVLVVDRRELFAISLAFALNQSPSGGRSATSWSAAVLAIGESVPGLLAVNPFFEDADHDAADVIALARQSHPALPVICWTTKSAPAAREMAERLSTGGYIHLDLPIPVVQEAAAIVQTGGAWWAEVPGRHEEFTDEELLVLTLLKEGHDLDSLRSGLHGRLGTAETWLEKLYTKLRARTHKGLVRKAAAAGLYEIPASPRVVTPPRAPL